MLALFCECQIRNYQSHLTPKCKIVRILQLGFRDYPIHAPLVFTYPLSAILTSTKSYASRYYG